MDSVKQFKPAVIPTTKGEAYFWGLQVPNKQPFRRIETGYKEARRLNVDETLQSYERLLSTSLSKLAEIYDGVDNPTPGSDKNTIVDVSLSAALQGWRQEQSAQGKVLPGKGHGTARASTEVIRLLQIETWPEPLLTNAALFGFGLANMLVGGHDSETLYSNYCADMAFFYEHGYNKVFPEYEPLLEAASSDAHALQTFGGQEHRAAVGLSLRYIRGKIAFEEKFKASLANRAAKLNRRDALILNFCDSSLWGMAAEVMARGFDKAGVINDFAAACHPCSDAIDMGSDLINSEVLNSFLNATDITESGIITEEVLRKVYDAYAHTVSKMFTERCSEPGAKVSSVWYVWHIINDRHMFLRRAVLGYQKVRAVSGEQREADFDEAFDQDLRTTGFSRPLQNPCNGATTCDHVEERLAGNNPALRHLWNLLATEPLQYAAGGVVSGERENELADAIRVALARVYSLGLVDDMAWLLAHASQHAWQVNYLMEAAMFGSLLDDGSLKGKLDRKE